MNDQGMKEFLAGAQVGIEAGIENLKEQIRSNTLRTSQEALKG